MAKSHPLNKLLERERQAILAGMFDELTGLAPEKERLLSSLVEQSIEPSQLRLISAAVSRNQTLLAAAIDGVRAVSERIDTLRRSRQGFESYGPSGGRMHVGTAQVGFEHKA